MCAAQLAPKFAARRAKLGNMQQFLAALAAMLEAAASALLGMALLAVPVLIVWLGVDHGQTSPGVIIALVCALWLLGHGVNLSVTVTAEQALAVGAGNTSYVFTLGLPLALLLVLTVFLGVRIGKRIAKETTARSQMWVAGFAVCGFSLATVLAVLCAQAQLVAGVPLAVLQTVAWFGLGLVSGYLWLRRWEFASRLQLLAPAAAVTNPGSETATFTDAETAAVSSAVQTSETKKVFPGDTLVYRASSYLPQLQQSTRFIAAAFSAALKTSLGLLTVAAVAFSVSAFVHYAKYVQLAETIGFDYLGVLLLFLLQLLLLPVCLMWTYAWLTGAGFDIGVTNTFSPFAAASEQLPALPLFALIPQPWAGFGVLAPLSLLLAVTACAYFDKKLPQLSAKNLGFYALTALLVALFALLASLVLSGGIGPGKLQHAGADPLLIAALTFMLVLLGQLVGNGLKKYVASGSQIAQPGDIA